MTPNKITESTIEQFAIELPEKQGYHYVYTPDIAPDSDTPERLQSAVGKITQNKAKTSDTKDDQGINRLEQQEADI